MNEFESKVVSWIDERQIYLRANGFINVGLNESEASGSVGIDIDTKNAVGTICIWFSGNAEFLVADSSTRKAIKMEEVERVDVHGLHDLLDRWVKVIQSV